MNNSKVIAYGLGTIYEKYKDRINWSNVIAIADKKFDEKESVNGKRVIAPEEIENYQYDYIVVFSTAYFQQIYAELQWKFGIPAAKILPWTGVFLKGQKGIYSEIVDFLGKYIKGKEIKSLLDISSCFFCKFCISEVTSALKVDIPVDHVGAFSNVRFQSIYNRNFDSFEENDGKYDAVLFFEESMSTDRDVMEKFQRTYGMSRYFIFNTEYGYERDGLIKELLEKYDIHIQKIHLCRTIIIILDKGKMETDSDISIYVVMHKKYFPMKGGIYHPVCVGSQYRNDAYAWEGDGDNIAYLNEKINECTALYWIWKNTDSQIVGLNHYRRYFYNYDFIGVDNILDDDTIMNCLDKYDMIVPTMYPLYDCTIAEQIKNSVDSEAFKKAADLIRKVIKKRQPDYVDDFEIVMNGHCIFPCNLFVTRREIFNAYCEWLFSFLIEAAEEMDVEKYDAYSKRIIGFFAERMLTVWLMKQDLKLKELPYTMVLIE